MFTALIIGLVVIALIALLSLLPAVSRRPVPSEHPAFDRLWLHPKGAFTRWEAEIDLHQGPLVRAIAVLAHDAHDGSMSPEPTLEEIAFCRARLADLDGLLTRCRPALKHGWLEWMDRPWPAQWRAEFLVEGFTVPAHGNPAHPWSASVLAVRDGHTFTINLHHNGAELSSIDG